MGEKLKSKGGKVVEFQPNQVAYMIKNGWTKEAAKAAPSETNADVDAGEDDANTTNAKTTKSKGK